METGGVSVRPRTGTWSPTRPGGRAARSGEDPAGVGRRGRLGDVARLAEFVPKVLAGAASDARPVLVLPPRVTAAWEQAARGWPYQLRLLGQPAEVVSGLA